MIGELGGCGSPKNSKFKTFWPCTGYMIHQSTWIWYGTAHYGFAVAAAEISPVVWGTPANFNGFHVLAALLHSILVVGVSQTLQRWKEGATYIRQGYHHVGHRPTFLVTINFTKRLLQIKTIWNANTCRLSYCISGCTVVIKNRDGCQRSAVLNCYYCYLII